MFTAHSSTAYSSARHSSGGPTLVLYILVRVPTLFVRSRSLVTTSSHFSAVPALKWDRSLYIAPCTVAGPSRLHITTYRRSTVQDSSTQRQDSRAQLAVHQPCGWKQHARCHVRQGDKQCLIPDRTPQQPSDDSKCGGRCGDRLHGILSWRWRVLAAVMIYSTTSVHHALSPRQL